MIILRDVLGGDRFNAINLSRYQSILHQQKSLPASFCLFLFGYYDLKLLSRIISVYISSSKAIFIPSSFTFTRFVYYPANSSRHRQRNSHTLGSKKPIYSLYSSRLTHYHHHHHHPHRISLCRMDSFTSAYLAPTMPAKGSLESIGSVRAMHERANAESADNSDFGIFQREGKTLCECFLPVSDCFFEVRDILREPHAPSHLPRQFV